MSPRMNRLPPAIIAVVLAVADSEPNLGFQRADDIVLTPEQVLTVAEADPDEVAGYVDVLAFVKCAASRDSERASAHMQAIVARAVQEYLLPEVQSECERRAAEERQDLSDFRYRRGIPEESLEAMYGVDGVFARSHLQ